MDLQVPTELRGSWFKQCGILIHPIGIQVLLYVNT